MFKFVKIQKRYFWTSTEKKDLKDVEKDMDDFLTAVLKFSEIKVSKLKYFRKQVKNNYKAYLYVKIKYPKYLNSNLLKLAYKYNISIDTKSPY